MAYVGTPIDTTNQFQSLAGKRFDGDGSTTAFTLDVAPSSTLDIEVFVGNVRQDPNSAYTLSGTTLTFTGAPPSGTNNIYVVHQAKSVGTIDVPSSFTSSAQTFSGGLTSSGTTTVSGALTASGGVTVSGTTPTLTIGDAGAEDAKIVFDGNAQDFHIGLDDSTDDLVIGKGSALGTTAHIVTDEDGHVTKPLQSAFSATSGNDANKTGDGTTFTVEYDNERYDVNSDYNTTNYTFTAPVTGKYLFTTICSVENMSSHERNRWVMNTSNKAYYMDVHGDNLQGSASSVNLPFSMVTDMDANDTCTITVQVSGGSKVVDIRDDSAFNGMLIG
jgi:hypothetical protein